MAQADSPLERVWWRDVWEEWASFLTSVLVHMFGLMIAGCIVLRPEQHEQISFVATPMTVEEMPPIQEVVFESLSLETQELEQVAAVVESAESMDVATVEPSIEDVGDTAVELDVTDFADRIAPLGDLLQPSSARGSGSGLPMGAALATFVKRLKREGAKSGDVQISLIWNNFNDLDLHVITPSGQLIFFGRPFSSCRGELDVDMNAGGRNSREPVENVYWPRDHAPQGKYIVLVHHFAPHGDPDPTPFEVLVNVDGETKTFKGVLSRGQPQMKIHEFERKATSRREPERDDFPLELK